MKQIGNLAVVCARRQNVLLQVGSEKVWVHVGAGPERDTLHAAWAAAAVASVVRRIWLIRYGTVKALRVYQRNVQYLPDTFRAAVIKYLQLRSFPKRPAQLVQVFNHALFSFPRPAGQSCCAVCSPFLPAAYLPKFNSWTIR